MVISDLIASFERVEYGKRFLYVPYQGSEELIVVLSAHNQKQRYMALKSFLGDQRTNLLFITDPDNTWYLDNDQGLKYNKIFSKIFCNYSKDKIFIFGSSMAGYAALHFAILNNVHCLVCNPQVDLKLSLDYGWDELNGNMRRVLSNGGNVDLLRLLDNSIHTGVICVVHGHGPIDVANVELLLSSATPIRKLLIYTLDTDDHAMPFGRDVDKVYKFIDLIKVFGATELHISDQADHIGVLRANRKHAVHKGYGQNFRHIGNARTPVGTIVWARRHTIDQQGLYFVPNIGYYNSRGCMSGGLLFFDGDEFLPHGKMPLGVVENINIPLVPCGGLHNNQRLSDSVWLRVPEEGALVGETNGAFLAKFSGLKNCYINFDLKFLLNRGFKEGEYITVLLDIDIDFGMVTLSAGAFGNDGYYQNNLTIRRSGQYVLPFHISSLKVEHKDALFGRVYFFPDGKDKSVAIKSLRVARGFFPMVSFFDN